MLLPEQRELLTEMIENMWSAFERQTMPERKLNVYLDFLSRGLPGLKDKSQHFEALMHTCEIIIAKGDRFPLIRDIYYEWVPDKYLLVPRSTTM